MTTISLKIDTSNPRDAEEGLALLAFLASRRSGVASAATPVASATRDDQEAERLVEAFWERTGEKTHRFVKEGMASFEAREEFSLEDLAGALGEPLEVIRRWRYAAIQRTLNKLEQEMPGAPPLFEQRWAHDDERNVYWMNPAVREAVLNRPI